MAVTSDLPYEINDADNHFNEPPDCFERYIDPSKRDLAIRAVTAPDGKRMQLFAGKPSKFLSSKDDQVTFSKDELEAMLGNTKEVLAGEVDRCRSEARRICVSFRGCFSIASIP